MTVVRPNSSRPPPPFFHVTRRAAAFAVVLGLGLPGLLGCRGGDRPASGANAYPALVAPTQPILLVQPEARPVGPLKAVPESEIRLEKKEMPFGTTTIETGAYDTDTLIRVAGGGHVVDGRAVEHRGSVQQLHGVGPTGDGFVRFHIQYQQDLTAWLERGQNIARPSPVAGKSYLLDVGPSGLRVLTERGNTPSAEEVAIIQEDHSRLGRGPRRDPDEKLRPGGPPIAPLSQTPTQMVLATIATSIKNNGMIIDQLDARFIGVREVVGVPCAVFTLVLRTRKQEPSGDKVVAVQMHLGGEYSVRLADGWEAELMLSGSRTSAREIVKDGIPATVTSAGFTRIHVRTSYLPPDPARMRTIESLKRGPAAEP